MHDLLEDGRSIRLFNVTDNFNREGLAIDVGLSLTAARVIRSLNQIVEWRGKPAQVGTDISPEFISHLLGSLVKDNDIELLFIQPSNPQQNVYVLGFNRTVRYVWPTQYLFESIKEVQQ